MEETLTDLEELAAIANMRGFQILQAQAEEELAAVSEKLQRGTNSEAEDRQYLIAWKAAMALRDLLRKPQEADKKRREIYASRPDLFAQHQLGLNRNSPG